MAAFDFSTYPDGTALNAIDAAWEKYTAFGWPSVLGGKLRFSGWGNGHLIYAGQPASYNNVVRAKMQAAPYEKNGVAVLATSTEQGYVARFAANGAGDTINSIQLLKNGSVTDFNWGGSNLGWNGDIERDVMLKSTGNASSVTLELYIDGSLHATKTDTPPQAGNVGLWLADPSGSNAQYDVSFFSDTEFDFTLIEGHGAGRAVSASSLHTEIPLSGHGAAHATISASLHTEISLSGHAASHAVADCSLFAIPGGLSSDAFAHADSDCELSTQIFIAGHGAGHAVSSCSLHTEITMETNSAGHSVASAELTLQVPLTLATCNGIYVTLHSGSNIAMAVPDWLLAEESHVPVMLYDGSMGQIDRINACVEINPQAYCARLRNPWAVKLNEPWSCTVKNPWSAYVVRKLC